jgi:hypothetical protein
MNGEHLTIALIAAIGLTWAALAAWRSSRLLKPMTNGWSTDVTEKLGEIKGMLEAHVNDKRAHNANPEGMIR